MMKHISYNSASCGWLTSIVGWSIYNVSLAVSRLHLTQQPGGPQRLQAWVHHQPLSGLCAFFTLSSTQMKSSYASQVASVARESKFQGYVPVCIRGQLRCILKYEPSWGRYLCMPQLFYQRGSSSSLHFLHLQNTETISFFKPFQHFLVKLGLD